MITRHGLRCKPPSKGASAAHLRRIGSLVKATKPYDAAAIVRESRE